MSESDEQLIAGVAAGDRDAFAALYRRRRADVYRFALHMTGAPSAAEDIAQDVFMVVMHEARRYSPSRAPVVPGLLGIARNLARRRMDDRQHEPLAEAGDAPAVNPDPAARLTRSRQVDALRRALATLPVPFREAVVLCDLQELSYQDAAAVANCAIGTVRSRLHRGRQMLSAKMRGERHVVRAWPARQWM